MLREPEPYYDTLHIKRGKIKGSSEVLHEGCRFESGSLP